MISTVSLLYFRLVPSSPNGSSPLDEQNAINNPLVSDNGHSDSDPIEEIAPDAATLMVPRPKVDLRHERWCCYRQQKLILLTGLTIPLRTLTTSVQILQLTRLILAIIRSLRHFQWVIIVANAIAYHAGEQSGSHTFPINSNIESQASTSCIGNVPTSTADSRNLSDFIRIF